MGLLFRYRLILILVLAFLFAMLLLNEHLVPAGDNATYIVLSQSLSMGRGYRMISDPRMPEMALYPPGYPLLLAAVLALTGTVRNLLAAIVPMKLVSIALYLAATALAYDLFQRRNTVLGTLTVLLMAVNPSILYYATEVSTEIPYLFLSLACICLFERYLQKPTPDSRILLGVAVLLALNSYVRSVALVMAAAFVLYLLIRRRLRHALLLLLAVAVLAAPWFIHSSLLPSTGTAVGLGRGYFALYFSSDPYGTAKASLSDWVGRLTQNLRIYVLYIWPDVLFPHAARISTWLGPFGVVFVGVISLLLALGFVLEARRGSASEWYVALFFASCVGYLWAQSRLVVPVIPFAIYYLLTGLDFLFAIATSAISRASTTKVVTTNFQFLACVVLLLSALVADVRAAQRNLRYGLGRPVATYYAQDTEWSNYLQAMNWIAENAPNSAIVMCRKADLMYVLTGHQALEYPYSVDGAGLMHFVQDNLVAYVIEDAFTWTRTTQQYLRLALQAWRSAQPAALSLVYETDAPRTRVWRVNKLRQRGE